MTETPTFAALFGRSPEIRTDAPGRVNLIGEHTDYSGGLVLPVAIPQRARVELAIREDSRVRAWSRDMEPDIEEYRLGNEEPGHGWVDYVQGITEALRLAGHRLGGFDLRVESDVPPGSGLSSSAALEVSLLRALREAFGLSLDDLRLAQAAQKAETDFVGAPVGIMDPMAANLADETTALFLDTRTLRFEKVRLPGDAELLVIDSGISHRHATGGYRTRRRECETAAEQLQVAQLGDLCTQDLWRLGTLHEPLDRRARHVVTENARVRSAVAALRSRDLPRLGRLLAASHESLRNDFEVSIPEIDRLVELAAEEPDIFGARITGGGFGGAIVAVVRRGAACETGQRIARRFGDEIGRTAKVLVPASSSETATSLD
ncbi:MAG TPA: galactokinase [Thermoanaerobaculia bacterium]|nr:galactokinase [Thermoanaerobaculia bacterium]